MTNHSATRRRAARTAVAITVSGSFLLTGTAAANASSPAELPFFRSFGFLAEAPSEAPRLTTVDNFRDVAGPGYKTPLGQMRTGVFYRSNSIAPDDADLATLEGLNLSAVYDLRTAAERDMKPDRLWDGANYILNPIEVGDTSSAGNLESPEDARNFMRDMNRGFVTDPAARESFATLLTDLAYTSGPQVFHCTAGKDRTGWTAMLLQSLVGVSDDDIMTDYLLTNEYAAASKQEMLELIRANLGDAAFEIYEPMLGVEASYLEAGLDELEAQYGTVDNYLREGLGLSSETLTKLKLKLLG
ncbi:protein tyrosine phosphatase [Rhodococcus sp. WMMA185]|uniref:tyrosine-protein phosphatase n=1 Tax=Rhodococcus sp. WMMA185 TaxID=679318 RepID=UPI000878E589|nr:tyrosine-protein phosphatase [Rhodococcus sp. WMMA185]AOW92915.1 protein tyrosine phosphatase [Rhodococcus sp. WMMA185]